MKRKIVIPIVLVAALVVVAAGVWWSGWFHRAHDNRLMVSGNIELTQVDISFKVPGKLVERTVDEGATVTKGMLIARIDRDQIDAAAQPRRSWIAGRAVSIPADRNPGPVAATTLESDIALRKAEIREAQARLDALLAGSRPQEIQQARAAVADARAQQRYRRKPIGSARRSCSRTTTSRQRSTINTACATTALPRRFTRREERLALVVEGPRKEEIEAARAQVATAQAALRVAEAKRWS